MIFWFSSVGMVCLTALAIAMLLTGHDALLENAIVAGRDVGMVACAVSFLPLFIYAMSRFVREGREL